MSSYRKGDKINYNEAMTVIGIDYETATYQQQNWIVRGANKENKDKASTRAKSVAPASDIKSIQKDDKL